MKQRRHAGRYKTSQSSGFRFKKKKKKSFSDKRVPRRKPLLRRWVQPSPAYKKTPSISLSYQSTVLRSSRNIHTSSESNNKKGFSLPTPRLSLTSAPHCKPTGSVHGTSVSSRSYSKVDHDGSPHRRTCRPRHSR